MSHTTHSARSRTSQTVGLLLLVVGASIASALVTPPASAQQPRIDGVSIDGRYRGGEKVRLMVDFVKGTAGDSITEILTRDLRYSDRYDMLPAGSAPGLAGPVNYALFAQLGAQGVVEASVLPSGTLHVELYEALLRLHARRIRQLYGLVEDLNTLPLRARLAKQLLHLVRSYGVPSLSDASEVRIGLQLAQEELAQLLGASRQRVNQELKSMERDGAIRIEQGGLVIRDRVALMQIIDADN